MVFCSDAVDQPYLSCKFMKSDKEQGQTKNKISSLTVSDRKSPSSWVREVKSKLGHFRLYDVFSGSLQLQLIYNKYAINLLITFSHGMLYWQYMQPRSRVYTVGEFMTRKEDLQVVKPTTSVDEGTYHTQVYQIYLMSCHKIIVGVFNLYYWRFFSICNSSWNSCGTQNNWLSCGRWSLEISESSLPILLDHSEFALRSMSLLSI